MRLEVSQEDVDEWLTHATIEEADVEATTDRLLSIEPDSEDSPLENATERRANRLVDDTAQLSSKDKVALIRQLITQLEPNSIQAIVEFGLKEIANRHAPVSPEIEHNTCLLLKKDYSYRARGLSEPTQYFVYLRRRKPKLDRYVGALFHVPQGCTLSYFLDAEERLIFNPSHNVFELRDSKNPGVVQVVRLICLEPPPPDYTFAKQQNDVPDIQLHLEYLHPQTYQPLSKQTYPFPKCMHEGGSLDRYRWDVTAITLSPELSVSPWNALPASVIEPLPAVDSAPPKFDLDTPLLDDPESVASQSLEAPIAAELPRRVLEIQPKPLTFYLANSSDADAILKRMRLWVAWSEKAMPQARWEVIQDARGYTLMNARFQRRILQFLPDRGSIVFEHSLPVLMKWFHDLSLAVSQSQNRRQYSATQLKLAHTLFVEMSLPQTDPAIVLKKLFGVELSKTPPPKGETL
jgi:hypothetical protein